MVRMKTEKIGHDNIIDVSSTEAQKAFFRSSFDLWSNFVRDNHAYTRRAICNGEALIMWRGRVSIDLMDVVDAMVEHSLASFKEVTLHTEMHWRVIM